MATEKFETWGIVELFGPQQIAGMVQEVELFGAKMLRVDVPEINALPGFTKFYGGAAVYALTPTDEATARQAARAMQIRPVSLWIVPDRAALPRLEESESDEGRFARRRDEEDYDDDDA